jgi:UDP-N-acetylmuramate dehydrogenase
MIQQNVFLKDYSNYKIGGPAAYFLNIKSKDDLITGLGQWKDMSVDFPEDKKKIFVLGKGTNVLISEDGFRGLIIHNSIQGIKREGNKVIVGAGELMSDLLKFCVDNSISGLEWAGGLPGTIGGAVRGNAGAFKGETKDNIESVDSLNSKTLEESKRINTQCGFDYRYSFFKSEDGKDEIILSVILSLKPGEADLIANSIREKIDYRNERHPMEHPNIGSTFKNVRIQEIPVNQLNELMKYVKDDPFSIIPVAKILYLAGVKGKRLGDAQISEKHPNFIINLGNAKSEDVKALIQFAKAEVRKKFGINLEEEIIYLE